MCDVLLFMVLGHTCWNTIDKTDTGDPDGLKQLLKRTHFVASSTDSHFVKLSTAALAAEYPHTRVTAACAVMDEILMMFPLPLACMDSPKICDGRTVPMMFKSNTFCIADVGILKKESCGPTVAAATFPPAQLTRISICKK